ncbi:hypothetical protein SPRG_15527 [Saprolegnia parasitica CBS 223.65]|uniref:Myotubularin phosphatase domain-containing protein n=1 Tax=Saprolegnia parasitica (strain CBS 223.65) TaxID=695850 RepID=A0A067BR98_SAPPC|nr:hypothetical protein SPRG_15527 [Saprolegnia parasitica CBS 223.65]KDO19325.1 hypothetical protein SPRG_15527 [Saprolegnia parasitica CBS 223.65]|eukprot:XP_012209968.1 hypothetical protein SPRG_15527 [Saprolegnia parasitica CBS 223.65]
MSSRSSPVLQQRSSVVDMAALPMAKLFGEREVMAEIRCDFAFAFAGASTSKPPAKPPAKAAVLTAEKKSRFNTAFNLLKDQVVARTMAEPDATTTSPVVDDDQPRDQTEYSLPGRLMMTTYRLQFYYHPSMSSGDEDATAFQSILRRFRSLRRVHEYCTIPLGAITRVEKVDKASMIKITTKDHRRFHLTFPEKAAVLQKVHEILLMYAFPDDRTLDDCLPLPNGWDVYDADAEWARLGVDKAALWRRTTINAGYATIESYPQTLIVPAAISDDMLLEAAQFRSIGRIPALTWLHPETGASLTRSSQPKVGMSNAFSLVDEDLVAAIGDANPMRQTVHIIDCRPMSSAVANRAKGYGVETPLRYKNAVVEFMNIPNIHTMRESMKKLRQLSLSLTCDNLSWFGDIEDTKWLHYVRVCLQATLRIVDLLHTQQTSVLVHCSHGWDRTSQLSALAQLCLDPYYRTIHGFQVLIEKDFLAFGHPFQMRLAHGEKASSEESPIFLQFLDCVWQLQQLYPAYFEFNEGYLCLLADSIYSCRFGTFLLNNVQARDKMELSQRTASLWAWLDGFRAELTNTETYMPHGVLRPILSTLLRSVRVWEHVFLRWSAQTSAVDVPCTRSDLFAANEARVSSWQLSHSVLSLLSEAK